MGLLENYYQGLKNRCNSGKVQGPFKGGMHSQSSRTHKDKRIPSKKGKRDNEEMTREKERHVAIRVQSDLNKCMFAFNSGPSSMCRSWSVFFKING